MVGGKRIFPDRDYSDKPIANAAPRKTPPRTPRRPASPPRPQAAPRRPQQAGVLSFLGNDRRPSGIRGVRQDAFASERGVFAKDPAARALAYRRIRENVSRQANREEEGGGGGVAGFAGRTLVNFGRQGFQAAVGLPGYVMDLSKLVGNVAITAAPGRVPPSVRRRAAEDATDYVAQTVKYPIEFGKDFVRDPIGTIEYRPLEVATMVPAGWSVLGRGAAYGARGVGAAGQAVTDVRNAGSVRRGVARTQARRAREEARERQIALSRIRNKAVGEGPFEPRAFVFRGRVDRAREEQRAAEVTGNRVGGKLFEATQRIGDWGSDAFVPGSLRYRGNALIAPSDTVLDREMMDPISVPQRPRSANPLTRTIQRRTDRAKPAIREALDPVRQALQMPSAYDSAVRRQTRNRAYEAQETVDRDVMAEGAPFARMVRQLKGSGRKAGMPESEVAQGAAAAALRLMGLNDAGFGSSTAGRDQLLENMRRRVTELDKGSKPSVKQARQRRDWTRERRGLEENIRTLESIPDEWLDPETAPKLINDLTDEAVRLSRVSEGNQVSIGAVSPGAAEWSRSRSQAQLAGARPAARVRAETSAPYRRDLQEAKAIREEIRRRETRIGEPLPRFRNYTTGALRTMEQARMRRAGTIRRRVRPYIRDAEDNALRPYDNYQRAQGEVERLSDELRALSARRDGSAFDAPLAQAIADRERGIQEAEFERDRAGDRLRMARQGRRTMEGSARGRRRRAEEASRREQAKAIADARFGRDRAEQRARMARDGRVAMERSREARLRRERAAAASRVPPGVPSVGVALGRAFNAGKRKGAATGRATTRPKQGTTPSASQSRAFGTMLRADGSLYVARRKQRDAEAARSEAARLDREIAERRGKRGKRTPAEERALRDLVEERKRLAELLAQQRGRREGKRAQAPQPRGTRQRTAAEERAARQYAEARGNLRGTPRQAAEAERRRQRLIGRQSQDRQRTVGSAQEIRQTTRALADAQARARNLRQKGLLTAYVDYDLPQILGMQPGNYFPTRPNVVDRPAVRVAETGGPGVASGARYTPPEQKFNAGVNMERGDIDLSPQQIINMLRESIDARERSAAAADVVTRFAIRDKNGRLITGNEAEKLAANNGAIETISMRQLARISSLSADRPAGQRLVQLLEDAIFADADALVAIPTAVRKGWTDALGKGNGIVRSLDYVNSLWKGGVLALNPRWYIQNFFGMWGQFLLGAGADLQAISMARHSKFIEAIPGRIAANGLAADLGQYARRMQGRGGNPVQELIRGGFNLNSILEGAPRRAMLWSASKRNLKQNDFIKRGVMQEEYLAQAWMDVVEGAKRNDPGAEAILNETVLVTERFMGNYSRYNAFEKNFLRLVFPFYGWMRAIHRLAFALPVKHPKRAALLTMGSLMAYEEYDLNRNQLTSPRTGFFVGNRMIGTGTWNPAMSVVDAFGLSAAAGVAVASTPMEAPWKILIDTIREGFMQAGPLVGIPYRAVTGETPSGIPERFSPGFDGRWRKPTGGFTGTDPLTGGESNAPPRRGFWSTLEQAFPIVNNLRRAAAGGTPVADASLAELAKFFIDGRPARDAPFRVVNDPRMPQVVQSDGLSALSNLIIGAPFDRVDWDAAFIREAQALESLMETLEYNEGRRQENIAQQRAKKQKARQG